MFMLTACSSAGALPNATMSRHLAVHEWLMHVHRTASPALGGMQCRAGDVSTNRYAQEGDMLIAGFPQRAVEHPG